jgi:hypothetical protein
LREDKQELLFCEQKRSKKNFDLLGALASARDPAPAGAKVFCFFFSKKKRLLSLSSEMRRFPLLTLLHWG